MIEPYKNHTANKNHHNTNFRGGNNLHGLRHVYVISSDMAPLLTYEKNKFNILMKAYFISVNLYFHLYF